MFPPKEDANILSKILLRWILKTSYLSLEELSSGWKASLKNEWIKKQSALMWNWAKIEMKPISLIILSARPFEVCLIPELIGRMPVICTLHELTKML